MKVYGTLDFAQFQSSASDLTSPATGLVYFNTVSLLPKFYNGSTWKSLATTDAATTVSPGLMSVAAQSFSGVKSFSDSVNIGSESVNGSRSLHIFTNASSRPEINFYQGASANLTIGCASTISDLVPNSAAGEAVIRTFNKRLWFTTTGGFSSSGVINNLSAWFIGPAAGGVKHVIKGAYCTEAYTSGGSVSGGTYTANCATSSFFTLIATGNFTLATSNISIGQVAYIQIRATGGNRTITMLRDIIVQGGASNTVTILQDNHALFMVVNTGHDYPTMTYVNGIA